MIRILDLHAVHVLPHNDDRQRAVDDPLEVGEHVPELGGKEGGEFR